MTFTKFEHSNWHPSSPPPRRKSDTFLYVQIHQGINTRRWLRISTKQSLDQSHISLTLRWPCRPSTDSTGDTQGKKKGCSHHANRVGFCSHLGLRSGGPRFSQEKGVVVFPLHMEVIFSRKDSLTWSQRFCSQCWTLMSYFTNNCSQTSWVMLLTAVFPELMGMEFYSRLQGRKWIIKVSL